jgi:hypothetical protein
VNPKEIKHCVGVRCVGVRCVGKWGLRRRVSAAQEIEGFGGRMRRTMDCEGERTMKDIGLRRGVSAENN